MDDRHTECREDYEDGSWICVTHGVRVDPDPATTPGAYIVGQNMVGYLPESEPYAYSSWEDAKAGLIWEVDRAGDHLCDGDEDMRAEADELSGEMEDLNLSNGPEWGTVVGYMSYWINYDPDVIPDEYNGENGGY